MIEKREREHGRLRDRRDRLEDWVTGSKRGAGESEEITKRGKRARNGKEKPGAFPGNFWQYASPTLGQSGKHNYPYHYDYSQKAILFCSMVFLFLHIDKGLLHFTVIFGFSV